MSRADYNHIADNCKKRNKKGIKRLFPTNKAYLILLLIMSIVAIGFMVMMCVVDAFPASMALGFVAVLILLLVLADFLFLREKKWLRILGIVIAVIYIFVYGMGIYYLSSTYAMFARISDTGEKSQELAKTVDVTEEPFNIYITGIDQWESEKGMDLERSDVNMIVTVNPKTRKVLLTSIPRDTYVPLHRNGQGDKITHTGVYGVDETINTAEDWTGLEMNYYVKMNFSAVVDVINAMGGVEVYSPKSFVPVKRSWWTVQKGWQHMNGKEALAFARERKAFDGEDAQRVNNQQRVVKAILTKMMSSSTLLTSYGKILDAAGDNMQTNMSNSEMQALVKMQLADLGAWEIESQKMEGEYEMDYVASLTQEEKFLVYKVDDASFTENINNIEAVMNPSAAELAEAQARKQKNSIFAFIKGVLKK